MVTDELAQFERLTPGRLAGETLVWTRPNFFALVYELAGPEGLLLRVGVEGIGPERNIRADTAEGTWRIAAFPLDRLESPITRNGENEPIAVYVRENPPAVRFVDGPAFQFRAESPVRTVCETVAPEPSPVFAVEKVEFFPRWRLETKLDGHALALPELPVLIACTCCALVFA